MLLAPSSRLPASALAVALLSFCASVRAEFTDTDHRVLGQINGNVSIIREWNEDIRDVFYTNSRLMYGLFGTRGQVSYNDFSPSDNIYEILNDLHQTIHDSSSGNELTILGALLGWSPFVVQPSLQTNGLLGVAYSINDRAKGILQEGANITGALYAKDYSKSIYELVAEGFQTMSNQNAEIVQHMIFTNLVNTVSAPVDLSILTNIAMVVYNSFGMGAFSIDPDTYVETRDIWDLRFDYGLGPVWASVLSGVWKPSRFGGSGNGGFLNEIYKKMAPAEQQIMRELIQYDQQFEPQDIYEEVYDYIAMTKRIQYDWYNTLETYTYLTNELNQTQFSNTFASVFSHLPELFTVSQSGEITITSNVVNNVGAGIAQVADDLAPRFYDENPEMPRTNEIEQVEDSNYQRFLQRVTADSEIDTSFSEAVRSANSSIAGSMDNWRGSGPLVVTVPGFSLLGSTTDDISLDMTLSEDAKRKINYYWDCLIKFLKVVMSLMFAIKSFMTIFGQASERDGMLFDI